MTFINLETNLWFSLILISAESFGIISLQLISPIWIILLILLFYYFIGLVLLNLFVFVFLLVLVFVQWISFVSFSSLFITQRMLDAYLETLPEAVISRLFASPSACLVVLRMLPPLAKSIVMRLLFATAAVPVASLEKFTGLITNKVSHYAFSRLRSLKILKEKYTSQTLELHPAFQKSLRTALTCGSTNEGFEETGAQIDAAFLAEFHNERWESMLNYMVSSADQTMELSGLHKKVKLNPVILELLSKSNLLGRQKNITSDGFQFLLQARYTQVWTLLLHYLNNAAALDMDPVDILNFLFRLGTLELGRGQLVSSLPLAHKRLVTELAELGVVYLKNDVFYAAIELSDSTMDTEKNAASRDAPTAKGSGSDVENQGFIIVETNYRIYAYTSSPLQISILGLFCSIKARFANLLIGRFTRHSARRALSSGITADQIIQYLNSNHRGGALPPTIVDQIKLWQLELDRFRQEDSILFRDFISTKEYTAVSEYAQDIGALIWKNDKTRMFFVPEKSAKDITEFVNKLT